MEEKQTIYVSNITKKTELLKNFFFFLNADDKKHSKRNEESL